MSWDLVLRHCATLKAATDLLASQIDALAAYAAQEQRKAETPRATVDRPETCRLHKAEDCARLCDDAAIELGGMGDGPRAFMCRGCGETIPLG